MIHSSFPQLQPMGSYKQEDVVFLLKDISHVDIERGTEDREEAIQSGTHYSEMLPIEYQATDEYITLFIESLKDYSRKIAICVGVVAEQIYLKHGAKLVLVSLARAGTPIGILIKRYIEYKYQITIPHYSISIIRDIGLDEVAIRYITLKHPEGKIQFVDGWTGKGAITKELTKSCKHFKEKYQISINDELAVLADPGYCAPIYGTREDFLIPSACLNSTVSGLVSRTVLNASYIKSNDFHGAKYYKHLEDNDVSNFYIDEISKEFPLIDLEVEENINELKNNPMVISWKGLEDIKSIQSDFGVHNTNLIKPGVGETTRVLLRRVPWKILVKDINDPRLKHVMILAKDRGVPIEEYKSMTYTCCGLIKPIGLQ